MRINIFSKWSVGGLSTFFQQINKLKNKNIYPYFFLFQPPKDAYKYHDLNYKIFYPYLKYKSDLIVFWPLKILFFLKDLLITFNILRKEKKSIALVGDLYSLVLLAFLKKLLKNRFNLLFIITVNYKEVLKERSFFIRRIIFLLTSLALKMVNCFIFVSKELKEATFSLFKINKNSVKKIVIYHGISFGKKRINIRPFPKKNPVILYVGRLDKQKDLETIIKAFSVLVKKLKTARLWLVGDGTERKILENLVERLGLKSKMRFWGWQNNVKKFYQKADIFIFASHYEGFSYVIIEAMSQGLPVITTNTPYGPAEILENEKYGVLVPMKNPQKMAEEVEKILTNKSLYNYYSKMSLIRAKFFSEKKMLNKFKKLFTQYNSS